MNTGLHSQAMIRAAALVEHRRVLGMQAAGMAPAPVLMPRRRRRQRPRPCFRWIWIASCVAALATAAGGVPLDEAIEKTTVDAAEAAEALALWRAEMASERAVWAQRLQDLEEEIGTLRTRKAALQATEARLRRREDGLRVREAALVRRHQAVLAALGEFRHTVDARMGVVQRFMHRPDLAALEVALVDDHQEPFGLSALLPALRLMDKLVRQDPVSRPVAGRALDETGLRHEGHFVRAGPEAFFIGIDGRPHGFVRPDSSGSEPVVLPLPYRRFESALPALLEQGQATLPVDVSGGALQAMLRARPSLLGRLRQGGIVMIPLLAIGAIACFVALWRYGSLMRMPGNGSALLDRLIPHLDAGELDAARRVAQAARAPWRDVLADAVDHWQEERTYLEEILQDRIATKQLELNHYLPALSICAAAAPLLGLLGTVTGMIHTFQLITLFGTGDARTLSGGISEALLTTQVGLIIAVPSLLAHAHLARKAKGLLTELENAAIRLVRHAQPARAMECKTP